MKLTFNTASLAKLSKHQLHALLAKYRAKLDHAAECERPTIRSAIQRDITPVLNLPDRTKRFPTGVRSA